MEKYNIIYRGEVIDTADSKEEALFLQREYSLAYGVMVWIKKVSK